MSGPSPPGSHVPGSHVPEVHAPLDLRPPRRAFVLAYASVVVAGLLGAAIGAGLADVLCHGDCTLTIALSALVGAAVTAGGVAVVAVLVLRAMAEWNTHRARQLAEEAGREAADHEHAEREATEREPPWGAEPRGAEPSEPREPPEPPGSPSP